MDAASTAALDSPASPLPPGAPADADAPAEKLAWGGLLRSPAFVVGALARLAVLPVLGSSYLTDLFVPFLDRAVLSPTTNPWTLSPPQFFPYGSVLFAILFVPRWLAHLVLGGAALGAGPLGLALVKGPLLALDLVLLLALLRLSPGRERRTIWFYWLNPVLFYITYVHGQLDVAAMSFLVVALLLLARDRVVASALAMAAAVLCKFHVVLVAPLMLVFVWNRHFVRAALGRIGVWSVVALSATALGFAPVLLGNRLLYVTAGSPEALRLFAARLEVTNGQYLFLGALVVLLVLGRLCVSTRISEDGLVLGAGVLLGSLVAVTHPAPGWFFWVLPFLALFFATQLMAPVALHGALVVLYFVAYVAVPLVPEAHSAFASSLAFTALQTALVGTLVALWTMTLRRHVSLQGRGRALLIGIAGDSGAGKSTLSEVLEDVLNRSHTLVVQGDDYHKWERGHAKWRDYTHLHPKANHLRELAAHVRALLFGGIAVQPHYDHRTGRFTAPRELRATRNIVVQGLHTLYLRGMRDRFDLKVFLDPDERVRLAWKLSRDVSERAAPPAAVLESLRKRRRDSERHIAPQRELADWIVRMVPAEPLGEAEILEGRRPALVAHHLLWNDAPIEELLEAFAELTTLDVAVSAVPGEINRIEVRVAGDISADEVARVAARAFPALRQITRGRTPPVWRAGHPGVNQLLTVALVRRGVEEA